MKNQQLYFFRNYFFGCTVIIWGGAGAGVLDLHRFDIKSAINFWASSILFEIYLFSEFLNPSS